MVAAETGSAADGLVAHVFTMSSNATLHDHHNPSQERKPARRSAANQARRRQAKSKAYQMQSALLAQQMSFDLPPSLDIKGQNATQSDNEGLGAGNERAGDGNAIAGAGIACTGAYTIAGMACAHELRHWTPPAPSPNNLGDGDGGRRPSQWPAYKLGDDDGGRRPFQWPADDLEHQFALGSELSKLLRSIGPNLGANMIILLHIAVRVVQEILEGERSAQSVNQRENAVSV